MLEKFNKIFATFYAVLAIVLLTINITDNNVYLAFLSLCALFFLLIPHFIYKVFKIPKIEFLTMSIYVFLFFSFEIGMVLEGYKIIPYYDKIVHTFSGIFFAFIGYILYCILKSDKKITLADQNLSVYTAFSTACTSSALWEIYEYLISILLGTDPQGVIITGISDTMLDIIVCCIGAGVFCIILEISFHKYGKVPFDNILRTLSFTFQNK